MLIATLLAVACAARTGAVDYAAVVREDGPLAWWRFEDETYRDGAAAKDEVAGRSGTYHWVQRETGVPGIGGHAARFDGTASFLEVPHQPAFAINEISVEFWFKAAQLWNVTQWPGSATFISKAMPAAASSDWTINAGSTRAELDEGRVIASVGATGDGSDTNTVSYCRLNDGH